MNIVWNFCKSFKQTKISNTRSLRSRLFPRFYALSLEMNYDLFAAPRHCIAIRCRSANDKLISSPKSPHFKPILIKHHRLSRAPFIWRKKNWKKIKDIKQNEWNKTSRNNEIIIIIQIYNTLAYSNARIAPSLSQRTDSECRCTVNESGWWVEETEWEGERDNEMHPHKHSG